MSRGARLCAVAAAIAALATTAGCGEDDPTGEQTISPLDAYVGKVSGSDALIAVLTDGEKVAGFMSDGRAISIWFAGTELEDGSADLVQRSGPRMGEVTINGDTASGEVVLGPDGLKFEAQRARGSAGLYEVAEQLDDDSFQAGWIVLPDGTEKGTVDFYVDKKVTTEPAPALKPTVDIQGFGPQLPHELTSVYFATLPEA